MDKDELIELILLNIERLGIVMAPTKLEQFAIINCEKFIGVYDPSSVTPFVLAHELIHAKYGDKLRHCDNDILSCEEKRANKEAILLLWGIYKEQGGNASYFSNFIEIAGCPFEESITILREIEINDENIKITATNDNDSNEVSKTQMNGENGIWHSTKLQKTNSPGVYVLSNWSLTGTTLSFESQQSDLTYPNGYSYASYGIDMHARNIVGDSISQTTDVPWTDITRASGVGTSGTLRARINNGVFYAQSKDVTIPSIAPNSTITIGTMSSKFSSVSGFDTLGLLYSPGQLSVASVTVGNDGKINIGNPNPTTMSGKVIQFSINIPLR